MFSKILRTSPKPATQPSCAEYDSQVLRLFIDEIGSRSDAAVLDVGRIYNATVNFLTRRVKRLFVFDIFLRMAQHLHEGAPPGRALSHFDYPPESFDGVLLWELIDRLDEEEGKRLVELCRKTMKPGGGLVVFARSDQDDSDEVNAYAIKEPLHLEIHPYPRLGLPFYYRQNRDIIKLLSPFSLVSSFICRNGTREFLFQNG